MGLSLLWTIDLTPSVSYSFVGIVVNACLGSHSITGGGPTSVIFSETLSGGSPDEWVTGLVELGIAFKAVRSCSYTVRCAATGFL